MNNVNDTGEAAIVIRAMTEHDVPGVARLEQQMFSDPWPSSAFLEQLSGRGWGGIVAEAAGNLIGYACYLTVEIEGHLTNIAVAPQWRRKSVARRLLEAILRIVDESGCEYLLLEVRPSNAEARTFYERHGFKLLYRRPHYYRHPIEDALVLVRYLKQDKEV